MNESGTKLTSGSLQGKVEEYQQDFKGLELGIKAAFIIGAEFKIRLGFIKKE
jgi:hypothetical protein